LSGSSSGLAAYESGFYAFTKTQGCVTCHGNGTGPQFAASDVGSAYTVAKTLMNFADPDNALFVTYAGNGHCGVAVCADPSIRSEVKILMEQWAQAEGGHPTVSGPKYLTASVALPATIPAITATTPGVVRFQLSQLNTPVAALSGAIFEVEIQLISPGEYRVRNPKIVGSSAAVEVTGIHVFLRAASGTGLGSEDVNQGLLWDSLQVSAPVVALPKTLPTGPLTATPLATTSLALQAISSADVMTIGFDNLE
jgi:hypothetical protein